MTRILSFPDAAERERRAFIAVTGRTPIARGVYWAPHLSADGRRIAYAIDSRGREVSRQTVAFDVLGEIAEELLWGRLDGLDPQQCAGAR